MGRRGWRFSVFAHLAASLLGEGSWFPYRLRVSRVRASRVTRPLGNGSSHRERRRARRHVTSQVRGVWRFWVLCKAQPHVESRRAGDAEWWVGGGKRVGLGELPSSFHVGRGSRKGEHSPLRSQGGLALVSPKNGWEGGRKSWALGGPHAIGAGRVDGSQQSRWEPGVSARKERLYLVWAAVRCGILSQDPHMLLVRRPRSPLGLRGVFSARRQEPPGGGWIAEPGAGAAGKRGSWSRGPKSGAGPGR